jgi:hypothetical protein
MSTHARPARHRFLTWFSVGTLTLTVGFLLTLAFWQFYPYHVIDKSPSPLKIVGLSSVRAGQDIVYEYSYTKYTDVIPTIHRQFVDGLIFESEDTTTHLEPGNGHVHVAIRIPETLPPGKYRLRIFISYRVNPIRTIDTVDETQEFTVLGHPDEAEDKATTP